MVREIQDQRAWLADRHESSRPDNIRFRARYRQPARYGKAERISRRENHAEGGGVFGDKGFIGTDYITTPIRKPECRELLQWEHEWNNRVSSFRAPVERAVATLKTWRILFTDYRRPLKTSIHHSMPQLDSTSSKRLCISLPAFHGVTEQLEHLVLAAAEVGELAVLGLENKPSKWSNDNPCTLPVTRRSRGCAGSGRPGWPGGPESTRRARVRSGSDLRRTRRRGLPAGTRTAAGPGTSGSRAAYSR